MKEDIWTDSCEVWCSDCNCKLWEADGDKPIVIPCPYKKKCEDEKHLYR